METVEIKVSKILMDDEFNCRGVIAPMDVVDLAKDIEQHGLLQPVVVQKMEHEVYEYKLLAGFRRTTAHKVLKRETIFAIIHAEMTEADARILNLRENINREDLTIMQEANALRRLKELGVGEADAGDRLGKSRGWIQIRYMLLTLPEEVQAEVEAGFITQTQIRDLYSIFKAAGKEFCLQSVRELKDAKIQGRRAVITNKKKNRNAKKQRSRVEIQEMLGMVIEATCAGFHTRCLAWASGEISDNELFMDVRDEANKIGKHFNIPTD